MSDEVVVREVRMHSPGWIEGVAHVGDFPGNCIVRLNASNEVVEIVPMNAPHTNEVEPVQGDALREEESVSPSVPVVEQGNNGVVRMGG